MMVSSFFGTKRFVTNSTSKPGLPFLIVVDLEVAELIRVLLGRNYPTAQRIFQVSLFIHTLSFLNPLSKLLTFL